ncbi:peptidase M48 Ste24p [Caldimicrobium thiodismutans]|jgi:predicted Zn-dependent protease|uniref:Peptidase M48 Ste24p n=1 Tax=Caldimicrobium thiodismutans TaxID=1653476 RepID=A0A0U5AVV8_9BACT|nr:M48 family metalloprotease [Caldimicrobium thiodismutans]BAU23416.1 peptidase M48 Ste24p [Caldimicrobium thiodismutans]
MLKRVITLLLIFVFITITPLKALISLEEEEKIGKEVLQEVSRSLEILKDVEAVTYVNLLGELLSQKGVSFSPFNFRFFIIKDKTFNAFSVPGGYIFLNTGLFESLESEDELAGILAHEMSHNLARHVAKRIETIKKMQIATTAATLAAIFLGGGQAGQIVGITGTALAQTKLLAYSRMDEEEADRMGFEILTKAGFNPQAMARVFQRLSKESSFAIELNYRYLLTHPLPQERLNYLQNLAERSAIPFKDRYTLSGDPYYFLRLKARIRGEAEDSSDLILVLKAQLKEKDDPLLRYQLGIALMESRFFVEAEKELTTALKGLPSRDYFKLDLAELYFQKGDYVKAREILSALSFSKSGLGEILELKRKYLLARAYSETGELNQSYQIFKALDENKFLKQDPFFYYHFGLLCSRMELLGESHFYFGKYYENRGDFKTAVFHYKKALSFLQKDSKMYLEAEKKVKDLDRGKEKKVLP